jgi:curved DNA-binding protein CbpA
MDADALRTAEHLMQAGRPEDVFGELNGTPEEQLQAGKKLYRRLSGKIHPDVNGGDPIAEQAYKKLVRLWEKAEKAIEKNVYGKASAEPLAIIRTKMFIYAVIELLAKGDLTDLFWAVSEDDSDQHFILKVAKRPPDRDLLKIEMDQLRYLRKQDRAQAAHFLPFLPTPVESFGYQQEGKRRQTNVFEGLEGFVSLAEVRKAYPNGIDPKDMAWMFRRLAYVLGYVHHRGVIHGAVLPEHVLIHPTRHNLMLVDWCYSVRDPRGTGAHIPAISTAYEPWYPPEVLGKESPMPGTDILMAARCMVALMGGDPLTGSLPPTVPRAIVAFFKGCTPESQRTRPQDAWQVLDEFDRLIERLWGKRTYRPLHMPKR